MAALQGTPDGRWALIPLQPIPGRLAQLGERRLDKAEVTGSNPVSPMKQSNMWNQPTLLGMRPTVWLRSVIVGLRSVVIAASGSGVGDLLQGFFDVPGALGGF